MGWLRRVAALAGVLLAAGTPIAAPALAQPVSGGWQAGPGATGDNTYAGIIESPVAGANVPAQGPVTLTGWFVDTTAQGWTGADAVQVFLGSMDTGTLLAQGRIGLIRADVASTLGNPFWTASGWTAAIDASKLPAGQDTLFVYAHTPGKGWWSQQLTVSAGPGSGEQLAPAPAVQGGGPLINVLTPRDGDYVSTSIRSYAITGTASDRLNGPGGIDWVELWLNGEANADNAIFLGDPDLNADGSWTLNIDVAQYGPINSNLYAYAHSGVNGKRTLRVVHFFITDRPVSH